ncbi:hypothetical protein [Helicobacter cappadocius]|uniref:Uncharacterized protein n=1 Tax=Helicobacter cappadocius TaxID=3063998 RepID=A0AA90PJG5_9HELI|nr:MULTISPECIES: hypothetical protein [unclassified Helicobacter]MDO7253460.1 hypothetical protein [Helicobacter sp. faydin-H75]MDP2539387.1 hypothetical protein [Helicobacter sp. faydin-H76]
MKITANEAEKNQPFLAITGKIKTYEDFLEFKNVIDSTLEKFKNKSNSELFLFFIDTYPINSYAIGYLMKLKENDKVNVQIYTNNMKTLNLFQYLELDKKFQIIIKQN